MVANSMRNEIGLRHSGPTFISVQNQSSAYVSNHSPLDKGDWSMAIPATPQTSRTVTNEFPLSVEKLIEMLEAPAPEPTPELTPEPTPETTPSPPSNAIDRHVIEVNAMEDDAIIMDVVQLGYENIGVAGGGVESGGGSGDQLEEDLQLESISVHSSSDNDDDPNEDPLGAKAETDNESRAYDTQDEMEQLDDVFSGSDVPYVRVDWTSDQLAEFVLEEDRTLGKFAMFIRNERIDGGQVPLISYDVIKDAALTKSTGEILRFLKAVEKWKKLFIEKDLNSTLSQSATENA